MAAHGSRVEAAASRPAWLSSRWLTRERVAPVVAGLAILAIWEFTVRGNLPDFVATPSGIVMAIPSTIATAAFWTDVTASLGAIIKGVAIGSIAGILVGVAMGRVPELNWFLSTYIRALYALPLIALVPLVIIWVGYQPAARTDHRYHFELPARRRHDGGRHAGRSQGVPRRRPDVRSDERTTCGSASRCRRLCRFIITGIELGFARGITNAIAVEVLASVPGMGMSVFTKSNELNENASLVYVLCPGDLCRRHPFAHDPVAPAACALVPRLGCDMDAPGRRRNSSARAAPARSGLARCGPPFGLTQCE